MKKVTSILFLLLLCFPAYSQDEGQTFGGSEKKSEKIEIYFDQNSYVVDPDYKNNKQQLNNLANLIGSLQRDSLIQISKLKINSYASPDGGRYHNEQMTKKRSNSIYDYLTKTISVPDSLIEKSYSGTNWDGLYKLVEESNMEYREDVLHIIKNIPEETWLRVNPNDKWLSLVDSRTKHLMDLKYGNPYRYIFANYFPLLRVGSVVTIYFKSVAQPIIDEVKEIVETEKSDTIQSVETISTSEQVQVVDEIATQAEELISCNAKEELKPLVALKTNLLFDVATLINFEAEVPIGERWSIAGEWIFPWWTWDDGTTGSSRNRIQLLQGNVMGKYWFGDRAERAQMTGWFAGVYVGAGLYDFEHDKDGVQGEFFIAGGLAGGYAHTINKSGNLRMEYSLGIGYLQTDYRRYTSEYYGENDWRAIRTSEGNYSWFGPTQAKVSLVWMLNRNAKRGGLR